jgi:UDP-N-acetylglucosamine 2-epimerase (non-hydrolysing)
MQMQGDGSGPLLCVLDSDADHVKAAALIAALATRPELPATLLVRVNTGEAGERHNDLFSPADRSRLIKLGIGEGTLIGRAADLMKRFEFVVDHCEPAAVLVFDASEAALHAGMVARSKGVPVIHVGAGLRMHAAAARGDVTRRLTDHLADVLYTTEPEMGLLQEGLPAERICFVGNLQIDALQTALATIAEGQPPPEELGDARHFLSDAHGYGLVTLDALANVSERQTLTELVTILRQVSRDLPLIWPMTERTRNQLVKFRLDAFINGERIACVPSQRYSTIAHLLSNATCVLSDAWSVQEEASALGIPCLTLGVEPGRPMAPGAGSCIAVGKNKTLATRAVWECIFNGGKPGRVPERWDGQAATRIATHLAAWLVAERARRAAP